ncbi:MAG: MCE family protein [Alphaproteobacteria bacterium]|nr:MCE family protein [Alphaproteobacteria bacterium]MBF0128980.1 MCE family protein [Alphaproteobacteria bacterium]
MKSGRNGYVIVGGFVLLMLAAMVASMALLAGRTGTTDTYHTTFDNVGGLKFGTLVLYEGFRIGQVEDIVPLREGGKLRFRVEMSVREGWQIPVNSTARIASAGLLSAVAVNIRAGDSPTLLPPGGTVEGLASGDLFSTMSEMAGEFGELNRTGLKPLIQSLRVYMDALGGSLTENAPTVLANVSAVTTDLAAKTPAITDNVRAFTANLSHSTGGENTAKIGRTLDNIERASQTFAALGADMHGTREKLDAVLTAVNGTVSDNRKAIDGSTEDLRYILSALARHVDAVSRNLEGASRNMYELSRELRQNPGLILSGKPPADEAPARR